MKLWHTKGGDTHSLYGDTKKRGGGAPSFGFHSEENGWPLSHRRKPLGGLAIGTPSFYQNHWVLFAKALGVFPKTIGWFSPTSDGLLR